MIIKAGLCHGSSSKNYFLASRDRRRQKRCRKHSIANCHHHHRHNRSHSREWRRKDDDDFIIPADCSSLDLSGRPDIVDIDFSNHGLQDEFILDRLRLPGDESHYITIEMEEMSRKAKKKRRKRRSSVHPKQKPKVEDPNELSKRARWTIIITAGLLLLTCMLLVGVTLRMAPIIDQMVRTQNEELVKSLNRQEYNDTLMYA